MKRLPFAVLFLVVVLLESINAATPPNIVFVLTDDQAPWAVGASGNKQAITPHMDRLFQDGAYLPNSFVVTPVCSPSRASLMASRYGSELGITDWIHPKREPKLGLDPATVTWPEVLAKNGYTNGLFGKWHLGVPDRFHPTKTGFHEFVGFRTGGNSPKDPSMEIDGVVRKESGFTADVITRHALKFLDRHHAKPFLLCVHYRAPHSRWLPVAPEDSAPYENLDPKIPNPDYPDLDVTRVKRMMREYLSSTRSVDRNLGLLIAKLEALKIDKKTIVIFTSDHGYSMGHNGIWHKGNGHWVLKKPTVATKNIPRNQRPNMYDNSLRVPTAVRWPGVVKPGTTIHRTISNLDWYPTILAMTGLSVPKDVVVRGRDFTPLLRGKSLEWDDDLYAEYSTHHQSKTHMRAYRTPRWKLVRDFLNLGRDELYDLEADPGERKNLFDEPNVATKEISARLDRLLLARMAATKDPVLAKARERVGQKSDSGGR
jgi:uncharacterized sulfatase